MVSVACGIVWHVVVRYSTVREGREMRHVAKFVVVLVVAC